MRGKGNIYPTSDYVTEHVMLANKKDIQQAQQRKRKASRAFLSKNKRQKRACAAQASVQAQDKPSAAPSKVTSSGRNIKL